MPPKHLSTVYPAKVVGSGRVCAPALVLKRALSFLGDVDPEKCMLVEEGRSLRGAIVVVKRFRGSTVGAYVLLAARRRGCNIVGIVCQKPDPVVIAGCVLAGIPIAYAIPEEFFDLVRDGVLLCIDPKRGVEICDAVC